MSEWTDRRNAISIAECLQTFDRIMPITDDDCEQQIPTVAVRLQQLTTRAV